MVQLLKSPEEDRQIPLLTSRELGIALPPTLPVLHPRALLSRKQHGHVGPPGNLWGNPVRGNKGFFPRSPGRGLTGSQCVTCPSLSPSLWGRKWMRPLRDVVLMGGNRNPPRSLRDAVCWDQEPAGPQGLVPGSGCMMLGPHATQGIIQIP